MVPSDSWNPNNNRPGGITVTGEVPLADTSNRRQAFTICLRAAFSLSITS